METVFKKGQTVYDQIYRKGEKGLVLFVSNNEHIPYVFVEFEDSDPATYTLDDKLACVRKIGTIVSTFPSLSTAPYEVDMKGFEQKAPSPSVEDANKWVRDRGQFFDVEINYTKERYLSKELYMAFEALKCLIVLRDYYNDGWQPDWNDDCKKFIIRRSEHTDNKCGFDLLHVFKFPKVLSFKTEEIRDKFFEEQKELLEMAKPLL